MFSSSAKTRPGPTMIAGNLKRQKFEDQSVTARSKTRSADILNKGNSVIETSRTKTNLSNNKTRENLSTAGKSKISRPSSTNRSLSSTRSFAVVDAISNSKASVTNRREPTTKNTKDMSNKIAAAKKPNGLPLMGAANRSKLPSTTTTTTTKIRSCSVGPRVCRNLGRQHNKNLAEESLQIDVESKPTFHEMGIQTQEPEILNHTLIVGDIKFLCPSKRLVNEIEKRRYDIKTKELLKATRTFEEHSEKQAEHLTDLKEFLEKSYVTKKQQHVGKTRSSFEDDRKYEVSKYVQFDVEIIPISLSSHLDFFAAWMNY